MAGRFNDEQIASTLNRLGMRTGAGNTWNEARVYSLRHHHQLPAYDPAHSSADILTLDQAAGRLGVSVTVVRRLIHGKTMPATQVVPGAPWQIPVTAVESPEVLQAVRNAKDRHRPSGPQFRDECTLDLAGEKLGRFDDLDRLTIFADNLVPHALRHDNILCYSDDLARRINQGELIQAGSPEEVEIRACAVHAVELAGEELRRAGKPIISMALDYMLWNRGQHPEYKAHARHRTRTVYY